MVKKLYKLSLKVFLGPFVATFFIVLFVILMQFLWKYVDELVGKGLEWYVIGELLFYASASFVPLALPLAVLLSSIMTFGELAENYELLAFKSAGISLIRIMTPLILSVTLISGAAFFFSNSVIPLANLKFSALLWDVKQQRPALNIQEGVFYNGLPGYSIRVDEKRGGGEIEDVLIYDHSANQGNNKVIRAERGQMLNTADERWLILRLYNGVSYEEMQQESQQEKKFMPHNQVQFDTYEMHFDLSAFQLTRTNEALFRHHAQMSDLSQLNHQIDSFEQRMHTEEMRLRDRLVHMMPFLDTADAPGWDTLAPRPDTAGMTAGLEPPQDVLALGRAISEARTAGSVIKVYDEKFQQLYKKRNRARLEWHRKFTLSFACLVLFFVGASMGAIIRKGGLGMPTVVSIFFFIVFHVLSITAEKTAKEFVISEWLGMWFPFFIITPIGVFLTYKANRDSALFDSLIFKFLAWPFRQLGGLLRGLRQRVQKPA